MSNPQSPNLGQSTVSFSEDRVQSLISHTTLVSRGRGEEKPGRSLNRPLAPPKPRRPARLDTGQVAGEAPLCVRLSLSNNRSSKPSTSKGTGDTLSDAVCEKQPHGLVSSPLHDAGTGALIRSTISSGKRASSAPITKLTKPAMAYTCVSRCWRPSDRPAGPKARRENQRLHHAGGHKD